MSRLAALEIEFYVYDPQNVVYETYDQHESSWMKDFGISRAAILKGSHDLLIVLDTSETYEEYETLLKQTRKQLGPVSIDFRWE